jgi:hypothetical protein
METTDQPLAPVAAPESEPSLWGRLVAVFARPGQAWSGLERRGRWWFPLTLSLLTTLVGTTVVYQRALVPSNMVQVERMAEAGQIPPEALDKIESDIASPGRMVMSLVGVVVVTGIFFAAFALIPWIGAGFMLGRKFRYRDAFVVTCWANLVTLPAQVLAFVLAWTNESMLNLHVGFGALLPVEDPPSKLMAGLGSFLDQAIGPFAIWHFVVIALGTAALSGAPRKSLLLVLGGLWLVVWGILSVATGLLAPGA